MEKNEEFKSKVPKDNIKCKDCMFRLPDVVVAGELVKKYKNGQCDIYEYPDTKPNAVLFEGADCQYYEKEK